MKNVTRRALVCLMSVGLVAAFAGTISGSIAWYAYSTRVTTTYSGTSVAESVQLQIGLVSNVDFTVDDEDHDLGFNLTHEDVPDTDYDYYWAKAGSGFSSDAILAFLTKQGLYATNELHPVTTREYDGTSFSLYKAPMNGHTSLTEAAATKSYSRIPFVFRIYDANSVLVKDADIWLSDATVAASGANENIREAVRLYIESATESFVLNPSSELTTVGYTNVGGVLDLNVDGVYDNDGTNEYLYGDWDSAPTISTNAATADNDLENSAVFEDANRTGQEAKSTFVAEHLKGCKYYDKYSLFNFSVTTEVGGSGVTDAEVTVKTFNDKVGDVLGAYTFTYNGTNWLLDETAVTLSEYGIVPTGTPANGDTIKVTTTAESRAKKAEYETFGTVGPEDDGHGNLTGGKPVTVTDSSTGLATLDLTIYLEGWDHAVIDKEINHSFNLGLTFQINRV